LSCAEENVVADVDISAATCHVVELPEELGKCLDVCGRGKASGLTDFALGLLVFPADLVTNVVERWSVIE
jgi:hypothetical protein